MGLISPRFDEVKTLFDPGFSVPWILSVRIGHTLAYSMTW